MVTQNPLEESALAISSARVYSASASDFALVLAAAAAAFKPDRTYAEHEVNDVLRDWLAHAGAMLDVDHVELRRWLVDNRLLDRDGFGRAYTRELPSPKSASLAAALEEVDLAEVARAARARDAAARERRKMQWEQRKGSAHE